MFDGCNQTTVIGQAPVFLSNREGAVYIFLMSFLHQTLVDGLVDTLMSGTKGKEKISEDTELFAEGTV